MPIAPKKYNGYALIQRPYYRYKNYWLPYGFNKQVEIIKTLDSSEVLQIETYEMEHTKEQYMIMYSYDEDDKLTKDTYSYDANYDLYSNINSDEYIYFIEICQRV